MKRFCAITLIFTSFFFNNLLFSAETCSRTAIINHQEVLVDTDSSQKGEGLRFFLEKDEKAKEYLDLYQKNPQINLRSTIIGTVGTAMLFSSIFISSSGNNKKALIAGGATILALNFLITKTLESANENHLKRAIEEYNKRNIPKIYFGPSKLNENGIPTSYVPTIYFNKTWNF